MIENFTPWSALFGGVLIGLGSLGVFAFIGRVAGISGILGQALKGNAAGADWRIAFVMGVVAAPLVYRIYDTTPLAFEINSSVWLLILSGLLVGFGTRLGNGCTSGHGISGISRFSLRSIVAVATFMVIAIIINLIG